MTTTARKWWHGLLAAFIGGAAGALDSSIALMILKPGEFNLGSGFKSMVEASIVIGMLTGVKCAFAYLKQSPLPPEEQVETLTITKTTTKTQNPEPPPEEP